MEKEEEITVGSLLNRPTYRFSPVKEIDRNKIITRTSLFQGRETPFSQKTVEKIVREGYDKSNDPIVVWYDKNLDKYVILSGHSRFEASRILYEKGNKELAYLPVKVFNGTLEQAIDYATNESNYSNEPEGLIAEIKKVRKKYDTGCNKECLKSVFVYFPESYLSTLVKLSYLNLEGDFIRNLSERTTKNNEDTTFPFLQRFAEWVGELRKNNPQLTDAHEKEIFEFLYIDQRAKNYTRKQDFYDLIQNRLASYQFNPDLPLNLKLVSPKGVYKQNAEIIVDEIQKDIDDLKIRRDKLEEKLGVLSKNKILTEKETEKKSNYLSEIQAISDKIIFLKSQQEKVLKDAEEQDKKQGNLFQPIAQDSNNLEKNENILSNPLKQSNDNLEKDKNILSNPLKQSDNQLNNNKNILSVRLKNLKKMIKEKPDDKVLIARINLLNKMLKK